MDHVWLEELSEDWPSQPGSEASIAEPAAASAKRSNTNSTGRTPSSRPGNVRLLPGSLRLTQSDLSPSHSDSSNVLSERSANEINIFASRRLPSKLSQELKPQDRGRQARRSVSASTSGSVVHNTVERTAHSASPGKSLGGTPEWRRRLLYNGLAYGEQRDLFSSASVGLEDIFKPPTKAAVAPNLSTAFEEEFGDGTCEQHDIEPGTFSDDDQCNERDPPNDTTMPSSPPLRANNYDRSTATDAEASLEYLPQQPLQRSMGTIEKDTAAWSEAQYDAVGAETVESENHTQHQSSAADDELENSGGPGSDDNSQIHHRLSRKLDSRIASGQSVLENESFSAILISPKKDPNGDGAVFAPVELPPGELKRRLENLRWNQMMRAEDGSRAMEEVAANLSPASLDESSIRLENTDDYEKLGGFINCRRGGRSADGSFRNRMLSPPLGNDSSEMLAEESLQASTPKQFATIRTENNTMDKKQRGSVLPRAPHPSPEKNPSPEKRPSVAAASGGHGSGAGDAGPSGGPGAVLLQLPKVAASSPLKLFGEYDTFTNKTLMRRISQYEDPMSNSSCASAEQDLGGQTAAGDVSRARSGKEMAVSQPTTPQKHQTRQSSAEFGAGELDDFEFAQEFSYASQAGACEAHGGEGVHPALRRTLTKMPFFSDQTNSSPKNRRTTELRVQRQRHGYSSNAPSHAPSSRPMTAEKENQAHGADTANDTLPMPQEATPRWAAEAGYEGKRPRTSPSKDPTPKRRRTLHRSDIAFGKEETEGRPDTTASAGAGAGAAQETKAETNENAGAETEAEADAGADADVDANASAYAAGGKYAEAVQASALESVRTSHVQMQSIIGRKRRDALDGDTLQFADPEVLANRQILRPRTPTPAQRSSVQREQHPYFANGDGDDDDAVPKNTNSGANYDDRVRTSMRWFGSSPNTSAAPMEANASRLVNEGSRKPSQKTEDVLNQAIIIMDQLRRKHGCVDSGSGPASGLGSANESDSMDCAAGQQHDESAEDSFQESTKEPFSRPPSREGKAPVRRAAFVQENPEVAARLQKYKERSSMDDLVSSTTRCIQLAQDEIRANKEAALAVKSTLSRIQSRSSGGSGGVVGLFGDDNNDSVISDPPNIRISSNPLRMQSGGGAESFNSQDGVPSQASQVSAGSGSGVSTGRSIPTGSSRGSESRKVIAPGTVSHLIPDEMCNMVFDHNLKTWVRKRETTNGSLPSAAPGQVQQQESNPHSQNDSNKGNVALPSECSEDYALAELSDLTVDLAAEMRYLKDPVPVASAGKPAPGAVLIGQANTEVGLASHQSQDQNRRLEENRKEDLNQSQTSEQHHDGDVIEHEISIDQGRVSPSSPPPVRKRHIAISFSSPIASIIQDVTLDEEVEDDRQLDNSCASQALPDGSSSVVAQQADDCAAWTASVRRGRGATVSVRFRSTGSAGGSSDDSGKGVPLRSSSRSTSRGGPSRQLSVAGRAFVPRPISRIEEREEDDGSSAVHALAQEHSLQHDDFPHATAAVASRELSLIGERSDVTEMVAAVEPNSSRGSGPARRTSLSFVVATPGRRADAVGGNAMSKCKAMGGGGGGDDERVMEQYVGMLSLSPMSEFTMHQDGSPTSMALEASYVVGGRHLVTGDGTKRVQSQSLRSLVERLAEVEPFEPYWEELETLDVQGRGLQSVHQLEGFCPRLVALDAGGNGLQHLDGVPETVRQLRVAHNQLSSLTCWSQLANLQYVDVSYNQLTTLGGLKQLVHLRGLRADHCGLANLDALILSHDGLQTLRARGNQISGVVDFAGTRLQKLVELDLGDNRITATAHVDELGALTTLSLRGNELATFVTSAKAAEKVDSDAEADKVAEKNADKNAEAHQTPIRVGRLPRLRTLDLSDNRLTQLDVRGLPGLRTLHADRNRLQRVRGFSQTPRLDSVSLREQQQVDGLDISSLYQAYEIRKLYLSGNRLERFDPPVAFLNLQLLELANCGLTTASLAADLGRRGLVPNLRTVNVNFNALPDLRWLRGIQRLKRVRAAGNRLANSYAVVKVLAASRHLVEVDLRDNPLTQGFYGPAVAAGSGGSKHDRDCGTSGGYAGSNGDGDGDGDGTSKVAAEPFALPLVDVARDRAYSSRLDLSTAMRRRVYEQVVGDACGKLALLDGLPVRRGIGAVRDAVWEALHERGIVADDGGSQGKRSGKAEAIWGAENSFA